MIKEFREPQVGDLLSAMHPIEYVNPYSVTYFGAGVKVVKPISFSVRVVFVSKGYVFYDSVSVWASGLVKSKSMQRMDKKDFLLDIRTGNLMPSASARSKQHT